MAGVTKKFNSVEEYLAAQTGHKKRILKELRGIIRTSAPDAEEVISYNMPAYKQEGMLVYFMAHTNHIGFYPGRSVVNEVFKDELKGYKTSKGTIQLPLDKTLPKRLIQKIVRFRLKENIEKVMLKQHTGKKKA